MTTHNTKQKANELLDRHASGRFPVPVVEIANALGIEVFVDANYPNCGNGHLEKSSDGGLRIIVNQQQVSARKRFTIAHEIAHYCFDHDYLNKHLVIDRNGSAADRTYRLREQVANAFAADLLMPEDAFVQKWTVLQDIEKVADYFRVSQEAARIRSINLGLSRFS